MRIHANELKNDSIFLKNDLTSSSMLRPGMSVHGACVRNKGGKVVQLGGEQKYYRYLLCSISWPPAHSHIKHPLVGNQVIPIYIKEAHTHEWPIRNFTQESTTEFDEKLIRANSLRNDVEWLFDVNDVATLFGAWPEMLVVIYGYRIVQMERLHIWNKLQTILTM